MSALLETLLLEQGETLAGGISDVLGVSRKEAARALPAAANVILERFEPATCSRWGADPNPVEVADKPEHYLDAILSGTGLQMSERLGAGIGISADQAVRALPVLVPEILRFVLLRAPYGSLASAVLGATVAMQGERSLDALAVRLAEKVVVRSTPAPPFTAVPGFATILGRWAGKWFPENGR
jgi:hypothetical protein